MTWEEARLISDDSVINSILESMASHNISVPKLRAIKGILETPLAEAEFHVPAAYNRDLVAHILALEAQDFIVYKKYCGRAVVI
jgi:hypothetical protein